MQHATECHVERLTSQGDPDALAKARTTFLAIAGMGCPNCANRVRNALLQLEGVVDVRLELPQTVAHVWHDPELADVSALVGAVARASRGTHHHYMAVPVKARF